MEELKASLDTYRIQLGQIESAIMGGQKDEDLLSLQQEMKELIALTEESLLDFEKSNLLLTLEEQNCKNHENEAANKDPSSSGSMDDLMASFYADINKSDADVLKDNPAPICTVKAKSGCNSDTAHLDPLSQQQDNYASSDNDSDQSTDHNDAFLTTIEDLSDISGIRCQAPFTTEWSGRQFHNAMIMNVDSSDSNESAFVKVLFLNPIMEEMKPCPYFLDGSCRFDEDQCRFSHGLRVSLYQLRKFKEPNFADFAPGCRCLAKNQNGLWRHASLLRALDDHQYEVEFSDQSSSSKLHIDDVFPLTFDEDSSDSEEETESEDDDVVEISNDTRADTSTTELGQWEQYTNSFGSRMLKKFGYKMGEGLGKDKGGRVDPVPVVVLPAGKSLDHCMRLKEKKMGITQDDASSSNHRRRRQRHTVFQFMNRTLGDRKKGGNYLRELLPKDSFGIKKEKPKSGACKIKVELVRNDSKIKQIKEKIKRYEDSISRNKLRDPSVAKKQRVKLNEAMSELKSIQSANKAIELHQNRADTHRKMTKF